MSSSLKHILFLYLPSRITYVQSTPGVPSTLPLVSTTTGSSATQQALPVAGSAYVPSALATLGFTAIAPPGQALVQPLITGQTCGELHSVLLKLYSLHGNSVLFYCMKLAA